MSNVAWPPVLQNNSAAAAVDRALSQGRLGHALLFIAPTVEQADEAARALTAALLGSCPHADYATVSPTNKMRQIGVEAMRGLREFLQKTSLTGRKVAHISEADRLGKPEANLFLKVMEEPPAGSTIILTTAEPAALLPTILSRAMRFRFDSAGVSADNPAIADFRAKLRAFLEKRGGLIERYALMHEAHRILLNSDEAAEKDAKAAAKEDETVSEEQLEALIARRQKALKKEIFAAMEEEIVERFKVAPCPSVSLREALAALERAYRLTAFNLNSAAALEVAVNGVADALVQ